MDIPDFEQHNRAKAKEGLEILCSVRNTNVDMATNLEILLYGEVSKKENIKAYFCYRKLGSSTFKKAIMNRTAAGVFKLLFPECCDLELIEGYFEVICEGNTVGVWPEGTPERLLIYRYNKSHDKAAIKQTNFHAIRLDWKDVIAASKYKILRTKKEEPQETIQIAIITESYFEDYKIEENKKYAYSVVPLTSVGKEINNTIQEFEIETVEIPVQDAPEVNGESKYKNKAYLTWEDNGLAVKEFRVYCTQKEDSGWKLTENGIVTKTENGYQRFGWVGSIEAPTYYKVTAVGWNYKEGNASEIIRIEPSNAEAKPLLKLDLNGDLYNEQNHEGQWLTFPLFDKGYNAMAAKMDGSNIIYFKPNEKMNSQNEITLTAWIKPEKMQGAIIAHGMTSFTGYMLDLRGDKIHFYLSGVGELEAQYINTNVWMHIAAIYDGQKMKIYINGMVVAEQKAMGRIYEFTGQLRIGQGYEGLIQSVGIWPVGMTEEQIAQIKGVGIDEYDEL